MRFITTGVKRLLAKRHDNPTIFRWIIVAAAAANILGLTSSIYAIQIFNRYIGFGLDGTLLTLTIGALVAIVLEFAFRSLRAKLASSLIKPQDAKEHDALFNHLNHVSSAALASSVRRTTLTMCQP